MEIRFGYGKNDIPYINRLKRLVFYLVVIIVFILNIFLSTSLNLKNISDNLINSSKLVVDLKHDIDEVAKNNLERTFIEMNEVSAVRYVDKKESFRKLQDELSISIPESSNPLYDSVLISLKNKEDITKMTETLEEIGEVKEVYVNDLFLTEKINEGNIYNIINIGLVGIIVVLSISCIFIFKLMIFIDFLNRANVSTNIKKSLSDSKKMVLLPFVSATLIGTLLFFNVYTYVRNNIMPKDILYQVFSLKEIFMYNIAILVMLNLLAFILPATIFSVVTVKKIIDKKEMEKKDDTILYENEVN